MQLKTVQRIVKAKMEEWVATIKNDAALQNDLRENILVSGGSILSLLTGQPVNDYDVYIKDISVLRRLVEYYAKPCDISILDGREKDSLIKDFYVQYHCDNLIDINNAHSIELRTLDPNQIKIRVQGGHSVNEDVAAEEKLYAPRFFSPNAISLTDKLQIVCRFHGDSEQIHKTFDFIHATNYFTYKEGLVTNKAALESILTKQLFYQGSLYPLTSIIRMKKFIKRGWNISAGEILKIMFQISELDLKNPDVLAEQLIGVDVAYFATLVEILRGVNREEITSHFLNTLIDRVFNSTEEIEE